MKRIFLIALFIVFVTSSAHAFNPLLVCGGVPATAAGAGPFTFVASCKGLNTGSPVTTVNCDTALNLNANDILVAWTSWQNGTTGDTVAVDENDGTDTFTATTATVNSSDLGGTFNYLAATPADASFTPRTTISADSRRIDLVVMQFRPTSTGAVVDAQATNGTGSGTTSTSGTLSTSVAATVVIGGVSSADSGGISAEAIGGTAATGIQPGDGYASIFYIILSATASNIAATATNANDLWVAGEISFK